MLSTGYYLINGTQFGVGRSTVRMVLGTVFPAIVFATVCHLTHSRYHLITGTLLGDSRENGGAYWYIMSLVIVLVYAPFYEYIFHLKL